MAKRLDTKVPVTVELKNGEAMAAIQTKFTMHDLNAFVHHRCIPHFTIKHNCDFSHEC